MHRRIPSLGWLLFAVIVLTLCLLSGCRSADPGDTAAPERASRELGERLLAAFRDRDYAAFDELVPESCRASTPETAFRAATEKLTDQFGRIIGWRCLGEVETPGFRQLLWLVRFERPRRHPAPGEPETVRRELIFRLLTGETADGTKIAGFGFL